MQVALAGDKDFNVNTPPFMTFFVDSMLTKMREKDQEATRVGKITSDRVLSSKKALRRRTRRLRGRSWRGFQGNQQGFHG